MKNLSLLLDESQTARNDRDWDKLGEISVRILRSLSQSQPMKEDSLQEVVRNYLSSIVGTGEFLTQLNDQNRETYLTGLGRLEDFLKKKPHFYTLIEPLVTSAHAIVLLALDPIPANRNKISRYLRNLARPDISVVICNQILEKSRLNYYAQTVLCGAYCDLGLFNEAIDAAETAFKYNPESGKRYPLNALVRAHTLKFKSNGDFSEIEKALEYGHQSIDLKLDSYAANAFIAAAVASGIEREIEYAKDVLAKAEPQLKLADIAPLLQAYQAAQALTPKATVVDVIDEFAEKDQLGYFDSLFELVFWNAGFVPEVEDLRQMKTWFGGAGWFLQGLSNVPCPKCETISLHSYRKHFKRYGKDMHYWALVCNNCKIATDSIDFDKKALSFISSDLEENYPVEELCNHYWHNFEMAEEDDLVTPISSDEDDLLMAEEDDLVTPISSDEDEALEEVDPRAFRFGGEELSDCPNCGNEFSCIRIFIDGLWIYSCQSCGLYDETDYV